MFMWFSGPLFLMIALRARGGISGRLQCYADRAFLVQLGAHVLTIEAGKCAELTRSMQDPGATKTYYSIYCSGAQRQS